MDKPDYPWEFVTAHPKGAEELQVLKTTRLRLLLDWE